jgi:hypothetical protein
MSCVGLGASSDFDMGAEEVFGEKPEESAGVGGAAVEHDDEEFLSPCVHAGGLCLPRLIRT